MTGNEENELDKLEKEISEFALKFGERCFSIRIIDVIPQAGGESGIFSVGNGDFLSQKGAVREWLTRQDEQTRYDARKDAESDDS